MPACLDARDAATSLVAADPHTCRAESALASDGSAEAIIRRRERSARVRPHPRTRQPVSTKQDHCVRTLRRASSAGLREPAGHAPIDDQLHRWRAEREQSGQRATSSSSVIAELLTRRLVRTLTETRPTRIHISQGAAPLLCLGRPLRKMLDFSRASSPGASHRTRRCHIAHP